MFVCFTFVSNYWFWKALSIEAYRLTTDVIIGTIALTYCLQMAHRKFYENISSTITKNEENDNLTLSEYNLYRSIHILVLRYNSIMHTLLFLILVVHGVAQIMAVVTVLTCKVSEIPIFLYVFLILCIIQATTIIIVAYGFAGDFHHESTKSLKYLKKENRIAGGCSTRKRKFWFTEKFLASCQVEKLQFGLSNFIEKATPLKFQEYCLDRIIDIVLLKK